MRRGSFPLAIVFLIGSAVGFLAVNEHEHFSDGTVRVVTYALAVGGVGVPLLAPFFARRPTDDGARSCDRRR